MCVCGGDTGGVRHPLSRMGGTGGKAPSPNLIPAPYPAQGSEELFEGGHSRPPAGELAVTQGPLIPSLEPTLMSSWDANHLP